MFSYFLLLLYLCLKTLFLLLSKIRKDRISVFTLIVFKTAVQLSFQIWINSVLFTYFDVISIFLNSIVFSKSELFGIFDFWILILRGSFVIFPLFHLRKRELKILKEHKENQKQRNRKNIHISRNMNSRNRGKKSLFCFD